jgi:hypothetical protein
MRRVACVLLLALCGGVQAQAPAPQGAPVSETTLRDSEFGVRTRQFGLQRRVEMYQWRRDGANYVAAWAQQPIDSTGFDAAHANPGAFPVRTRYWIATRVLLDGKPVDEDVLKESGTWRDFRPGFSALPGNLSATFQPEGDGLSSSENPLDPQVGDLRITWHELTLPPLAGKVALQGDTWVPAADIAADAPAAEVAAQASPAAAVPQSSRRPWWLFGAGVLVVLAAWALLRRRGKR